MGIRFSLEVPRNDVHPRSATFLLPLGDTNVATGVSRIPGPLLHADAFVQFYEGLVSAPCWSEAKATAKARRINHLRI